jgi:2-polyprenyl-6-methoxyphenol hydroxylase-like FAD-dependent oxidoreductase
MSYVRRWSRAGLLLIGDAAHVMSSIGGVGIMCAMQDAVETANVLVEGLRDSRLEVGSLARVQRRRGLPTRVMQFLQFVVERQYVRRALNPDREFRVPIAFRLPGIRALIARVSAYGVWPVRLRV